MFSKEVIKKFEKIPTPFYYYDAELLKKTLTELKKHSDKYNFHVHYALKANSNSKLLKLIKEAGLGADCVSGNEVKRAVECGFDSHNIVFAGVGKSDAEINYALQQNIFSFNAESMQELDVLDDLAKKQNKIAPVALRINPNVDAHTHKYITTGLEENKFGINPYEFDAVIEKLKNCKNLKFIGIHFHIGSQVTDLKPFKQLCLRVNEINTWFLHKGYDLEHLNVGGGLGINYQEPDKENIVNYEEFFNVFHQFLEIRPNQKVHFELGRAIVAQCGNLISRVLFVKNGINTNFAILDAGMTELIRPALYQAYHKIQNLTATLRTPNSELSTKYDIVGPICESSDCFGKAVPMQETFRNDLIVLRSTGAYGEVMASQYNLRDLVKPVYSDEI